jgi:hypothetical protein
VDVPVAVSSLCIKLPSLKTEDKRQVTSYVILPNLPCKPNFRIINKLHESLKDLATEQLQIYIILLKGQHLAIEIP